VLAIPESDEHVLWDTLKGRGVQDIAAVYAGSASTQGTAR
jgi:hypothetical protein